MDKKGILNHYEVLNVLFKYEHLGERLVENGAYLIGKVPHIAPQAWLHNLFAPLNNEEIDFLENKIGKRIPSDYRKFLTITNGLDIFSSTISFYGFRKNYIRDLINVWQPFDITTPNVFETPYNITENIFIIGCYNCDGSYLYIDSTTNKVHLCSCEDITSLFEWINFEDMLQSEIIRISKLFDEKGRKLKSGKKTLPIK